MLRQSDCVSAREMRKDIQGQQRLRQAGADNDDVPFCVVERVHCGWSVSGEVEVARKNLRAGCP